MSADQDAWENNRLLISGAMAEGEVSLTFDDGEDQRVQLIVHSLKPPFLDGRVSFSMQQVRCRWRDLSGGGQGIDVFSCPFTSRDVRLTYFRAMDTDLGVRGKEQGVRAVPNESYYPQIPWKSEAFI